MRLATIEFTELEATRIINLLHRLVKHEGFNSAKECVYFQDKIAEAFVEKPEQEEIESQASN